MKKKTSNQLQAGLGFWELTFKGQRAIIKHEQGIHYVAWLVSHPGESIHAIDLATATGAANGKHDGMTEMTDLNTGQSAALESHARIQERAPALDGGIKAMRTVLQRQSELEALVELAGQSEPVKEEAYRELEALYDYEKRNSTRVRDAAAKASDAVGRAVKRLRENLNRARKPDGRSNRVLGRFAEHIHKHILIPSGRGVGQGGVRASFGQGGFLVYEAPRGIKWEVQ